MNEAMSIKEAALYLNVSYKTVFNNRHRWGFFRMPGMRSWRINKSDLDQLKERANNNHRLALLVDDKNEVNLCRSTKEKISGGLILQRQTAKELDELLARL